MADETSYADVVKAYSEQNLRASLAQAVNQAPDQEAGVQALASQYNLPVESVRLQQPEIERRAKLDSVDYGTLVSEYKKTTKFLSDRNNAAVGHDDIDTLTAYEALYGSISPIRGPEPSLWSTIRGVGSSVVTGLELTRQGIRQQYADLFGLPEMSRNAQQKAEGARLTQEQYDPEFQTSLGGGVYSGLTSTAQMAGPVVASIATGNPLPAIAAAGVQTQTEAYTRYRARGASPGQAFLGSALEGGTEVATEAIPMGFLVNRFGKVGAGEFLSGLLGRELPSEQIATIVQDAIDTAIANPDKTWGEYFAERPDAAYQTALATITGSAVMGGASAGAYVLSGERNRAMKAQKDAEALTKIDAVVAASKLRERSPQKFEEFVAQATEDGPVQNIYIDPKALAQSGVNPEELAKVSRSVAEQVNTAITTGVDIRIPIAEYSTYIAGTDAGKALLDYIKTDPEGMSRKEAEEFYQKEGDALKAEVEKVLTAKQNDEAWQQSLAQVKEDFMGKLQAANRFTPDVNEAYLAPYLAGVQVRAAKMGITPMDFYKQYGLGVQAESVVGPALDQKQSPEDFSNTLSEKYGADVVLVGKDTLALSTIRVPEGERGQGTGTKMMQEIIGYADAQGKRIVLSPSTDFGATSKARLTKFYKRFGFVENKGKNKDFSTREAMLREPQKPLAQSPNETSYTEATIEVDGKQRPTTNSNGQPVAQTKEALENFWKWFGGSKVVDADGKPLVVYHGTRAEITEFQTGDGGEFGPGIYLTTLKNEASDYARGGSVMELYISAQNPLNLTNADTFWSKYNGNDSDADAVKRLLADGYDAISITRPDKKYVDGQGFVETGDVSTHYVVFKPEQIKSAIANTGAFNPNDASILNQGKRGAYSPKQRMTTLLNAADLTTFLHELGHYFLDIDTQIAMRADAPAEIKADVDTVLKWFGLEGDTPEARLQRWMAMPLDEQRPYHEQFAESFEHYLFEGKAPSIELQNVFKRFRAWMLATYKSLQDFLSRNPAAGKLNDEIRGVMDRMLATTEQIKEAEITRSMQPLFVTPEDAKMTPEEFKAYHDLGVEATQDAVDNLERRSMRDMQWASNAKGKVLKQLQKDVAAKRASVRREVTEEVMNEPINRAREFLKRGTLEIDENANQDMRRLATELGMEGSTKLNLGALKEMYGEESNTIWRNLPTGQYGFVSNDGIHPDAVAEMFGFSSGDELVRELLAAENPRDKIAGLTDQRMLERYGDITNPSELKKAADAAIHNDVRTRFVATELNALQKATGGRKILAKAAKEYAEAMVARLKVRDLSPARFASAEARAAKAAETALKAGKLPEAAIEKRNQLINTYATQAAYKAQDEVEKGLRYLKKFDKESVAKSIDPDYVDQIHALMERFDLRKSTTLKDIAKRKALTEWVAKQQELGLEPEIPAEILNEANRKSYKEMQVEEMRGLLDTIKQIEHLGRLKNKLLTAQDQRAFDAIVQEMVVGINEAAGSKPRVDNTTPNTNAGQVVLGFKSYLAAHRKMASLAREMDGWKDGGPVWNTLIRSMNTAGDTEATMRAKASRELAKLVQPVLKEGKMGGKGVFFPTLNRSLNREARIAIALNMGNAGNIQRLLDGEGWTAEQLKPVLDTITPAEAEFVQNVWDFFESFRPQIAAKERRVYGKEPAWVEPQPVMLGGKELRGGYYPIKFDPRRSQAAEQHNDAEKAQQMMRGAYTSATTRRSFTKTRVDEVKGRPLLYSMDGIFQGVNEVIHDLSWHEWLIDANRLFRNKSFDGAIRNRFGADVVKQFKGGIEAVASGETRDTHVLDKPVNYLRMGTSISGLGFNLVNSLVNLSGITQSAVRVGAPWIAQGAGALARNPVALITQIHELSPFMRERSRTFNREVNEVLSVVRGQSKARQHMTRFFYAPMMVTQLAVDMPTWWGAYQKALSQGNEDAKAVAMADQAVIDSQSAGQIKDLAAIQRGSPIWKLFTTFYGYFSSTYNLTTEAVKKTDFNDPLDVLRLGGDFALLYAVPVLFSVAIKAALMGGDDDEDKLYEKMAAEGIGYMMGTMVGLREFSGAVQTAAGVNQYGGDYGGPAGLRLFNAVAKLAKQAEQGEMDRPLLRQAINVGGILLHLPSGQINRTIDGMTALSEGRTRNPLAIVGGAPTK